MLENRQMIDLLGGELPETSTAEKPCQVQWGEAQCTCACVRACVYLYITLQSFVQLSEVTTIPNSFFHY